MEKNQEKEYIIIILVESIKENGTKTRKMAMESLNMPIMINIKECGEMVKGMEMGSMSILMGTSMMANGSMI